MAKRSFEDICADVAHATVRLTQTSKSPWNCFGPLRELTVLPHIGLVWSFIFELTILGDKRVTEVVPSGEIIGTQQRKPFASGLRPAVTSCPNLALPVHLAKGLTG